MIFIDTSWFYAVEVEADLNHEKALKSREELSLGRYGTPYTTDYVLDEVVTLLRYKANFNSALRFKRKVDESKVLKIIWIEEGVAKRANDVFKKYPNLELSFTDCTSFVVMESLGIRRALAFDEDFREVGFETLP